MNVNFRREKIFIVYPHEVLEERSVVGYKLLMTSSLCLSNAHEYNSVLEVAPALPRVSTNWQHINVARRANGTEVKDSHESFMFTE